MKVSYVARFPDNNSTINKKTMPKKLHAKKNQRALLWKNKIKALQTIQTNTGKLHVFNQQLTGLIDSISDTALFKDWEGRKLITNKLTKRLFEQHDLHWYGKTHITVAIEHQQSLSHGSPVSELRHALARHQLKLYYQIQVDSNRQTVGAEALLRWQHPKYGLLDANQFIPIAEQSGLILPIGEWVLKNACKQLKRWQNDPDKKHLSISVNISPNQFNHPEFVEQLCRLLKKTGINPVLLKLELTETVMLHDIARTIEKMETLKAIGIRFSMDNFGTGYSSLNHLKQLPINQLKIDQFLMRDIAFDDCDAMIVKTIIDMTGKLGVNVLAEGVETEQQFACLKSFQCSAYQGYLFGEPMALDQFEKSVSPDARCEITEGIAG
jgi:EAL domain-containing protein (putative c-di-GMP-specific phosphodiesterase class I)